MPWRGLTTGTTELAKCADGNFLNGWFIQSSATGVETVRPICRTFQMDAPPKVQGLTATVTTTLPPPQVQLTWNPVEDATSYVIQRGTSATGSFTTVGTATGTTIFVDSGLTHDQVYFCVVLTAWQAIQPSRILVGQEVSDEQAWTNCIGCRGSLCRVSQSP